MAREVELRKLGAGGLDIGKAAERVLSEFYEEMRLRSAKERERLNASSSRGAGQGSSKWNRQELYLDGGRRERAAMASRRHLASHLGWLQGLLRLGREDLRSIVGMQHFLQVDIEDLSLPEGERRSEDTFAGTCGHISEQMLLDAPRSTFAVDGEEFDFSREQVRTGASMQRSAQEVLRLQRAFTERLADTVRSCLGGSPPPLLLRAVTTAMSQSGLANVERACETPHVAVCGGEQLVKYDLRATGGSGRGPWDLRLAVNKAGFEQCIVCSPPTSPGEQPEMDPTPRTCGPASSIAKSCTVRFRVSDAGVVEGDVLELRSEINVVDERGRPLPGLWRGGRASRRCGGLRTLATLALRVLGACGVGCVSMARAMCCSGCPRTRARLGLVRKRVEPKSPS